MVVVEGVTYILVVLLDTQNLSSELCSSFEACGSSDTVTQNEALACFHVLITKGAVFLLQIRRTTAMTNQTSQPKARVTESFEVKQ
jgi:hypothetical protein